MQNMVTGFDLSDLTALLPADTAELDAPRSQSRAAAHDRAALAVRERAVAFRTRVDGLLAELLPRRSQRLTGVLRCVAYQAALSVQAGLVMFLARRAHVFAVSSSAYDARNCTTTGTRQWSSSQHR